jgi:hypothetical protein
LKLDKKNIKQREKEEREEVGRGGRGAQTKARFSFCAVLL